MQIQIANANRNGKCQYKGELYTNTHGSKNRMKLIITNKGWKHKQKYQKERQIQFGNTNTE